MKKLDQKIIAMTWCSRCDASKGQPCCKKQLHRDFGFVSPHPERVAQYQRRLQKLQSS